MNCANSIGTENGKSSPTVIKGGSSESRPLSPWEPTLFTSTIWTPSELRLPIASQVSFGTSFEPLKSTPATNFPEPDTSNLAECMFRYQIRIREFKLYQLLNGSHS